MGLGTTTVYVLLVSALILMVVILLLTWRSGFPESKKIALTVVSIISPWTGAIVYLVFRYQHQTRQKEANSSSS